MNLTASQVKAMINKNRDNVKKTPDGGSVPYISIRQVVLIGDGHDAAVIKAVKDAGGGRGTIQVDKGSMLDKGELIVTGKADQMEFKEAIKSFSKKKVTFK